MGSQRVGHDLATKHKKLIVPGGRSLPDGRTQGEAGRGSCVQGHSERELLSWAAATAGTCRMVLDSDLTGEDSQGSFGRS